MCPTREQNGYLFGGIYRYTPRRYAPACSAWHHTTDVVNRAWPSLHSHCTCCHLSTVENRLQHRPVVWRQSRTRGGQLLFAVAIFLLTLKTAVTRLAVLPPVFTPDLSSSRLKLPRSIFQVFYNRHQSLQIQIQQIQIKSYSALSYRGGRECITLSKCQMKQMSLESAAESRMVIDGA